MADAPYLEPFLLDVPEDVRPTPRDWPVFVGDGSIVLVQVGRHGFDMLDHTDASRAPVTAAMDRVVALLG